MFYRIKENSLYDYADYKYLDDCLETNIITASELTQHPNKVIVVNGVLALNPNYEEEEAEKERERIANLTRTRAEVWRALILARMFTKAMVKEIIEALPEETEEEKKAKEIARIDVDDVEDFHRGHALVNLVGEYLAISSENLDLYFETGDYHYLEELE